MSAAEESDPGASMRAGTRDRDATAQTLQNAYAEGRLTSEEHDERLSKCYQAVTLADLAALTADLPATDGAAKPAAPATPAPPAAPVELLSPATAWSGSRYGKTLMGLWIGWAALSVFMIFIWAFSGMGYFWPIWVIVPTAFGAVMTTIARKNDGNSR